MSERVRVRIVPEYPGLVISSDGRIQGPSGKWLKAFPGKQGYLRFNIYRGNQRWTQHGVHAAVCVAFHGPRPEGQLVRHLDGNPGNNQAENLAWGTSLDNEADKIRHGRSLTGTRHHQAKLTEDDVRHICSSGMTGRALALNYGVTESTVSAIRKRKTWTHI